MKQVWYINHYAGGPGLGRAYRPYLLSKELKSQEVEMTVVTSTFNHLNFNQKQCNSVPSEFETNINYEFIKTPSYQGNGLGRLKNSLTFGFNLLKLRRSKTKPSTIVYSSPHLFGIFSAWFLAKKFNAKLILEVRDIWPLSLIEIAGVSAFHPIVLCFKLLEKWSYKIVDHRVALLKGADKHFTKVSKKQLPFTWIPNGADLTLKAADSLPETIVQKFQDYKQKGFCIFGYAGALGEPNAMQQFIEAMVKQKGAKTALFIIGDGPLKNKLIKLAKQSNISTIEFFSPVTKIEALAFINNVDIAVLGWLDKSIYDYGISPNKVFDYMLCKKPILHACSSPHDPVVSAHCGVSVKAMDASAISSAMTEMASLSKRELNDLGEQGYQYLIEQHDMKVLAARYKEIFN
ncbi:MAG: glycosyltransferase family 4 protein [Gammaproteobacteria bacterium]|nr:glycosyltransferase family 4 protein [Gammaproteobacteria bacterium]